MKASINIEFTDEELVKHAADVGRRVGADFLQDVVKTLGRLKLSPSVGAALQQAISTIGSKPSTATPSPQAAPRTMDRCERVGSMAGLLDEGWTCCRCGTYNGLHRPACRDCGHDRCDIVIPPPPPAAPRKPPSDPSVQ